MLTLPKVTLQLSHPVHWFKAFLLLEMGILPIAWVMSEPAAPMYGRPVWAWVVLFSLVVGLWPVYGRKKFHFVLIAILSSLVIGGIGAMLVRYWEAEMAGFVPILMLWTLIGFEMHPHTTLAKDK